MKLSLTQTLIDSQKTRKQITGQYTSVKTNDELITEITGYCAMGALYCESNNVNESGHVTVTSRDMLIKGYGIKVKQINCEYMCPHCKNTVYHLGSFIVHLNDHHGKTFRQIGRHLRKLGF